MKILWFLILRPSLAKSRILTKILRNSFHLRWSGQRKRYCIEQQRFINWNSKPYYKNKCSKYAHIHVNILRKYNICLHLWQFFLIFDTNITHTLNFSVLYFSLAITEFCMQFSWGISTNYWLWCIEVEAIQNNLHIFHSGLWLLKCFWPKLNQWSWGLRLDFTFQKFQVFAKLQILNIYCVLIKYLYLLNPYTVVLGNYLN